MFKILYLSCHDVLQYDELSMFHELGYNIFSPSSYVEPLNPGDPSLRPSIPGLSYDSDIIEQWNRLSSLYPNEDPKNHLTKEFVDNFDIIIVMHLPRWIENNWEAIKHKRVIWRTIGQSVENTEFILKPYKKQGMEIVRYSPMERCIPGYLGEDALIRFGKNINHYGPWNGKIKKVVTFANNMKNRGEACGYKIFREVTDSFPRLLYGPQNNQESWMINKISYEQLLEAMRNNRCYFYTGTHPASYTLNFIEAWLSGIPIVAIGPEYGNAKWCKNYNLYEIPNLISNGQDGFFSDNYEELKNYIKELMNSDSLANKISYNARIKAIKYFDKEQIKQNWKKYIEKGL